MQDQLHLRKEGLLCWHRKPRGDQDTRHHPNSYKHGLFLRHHHSTISSSQFSCASSLPTTKQIQRNCKFNSSNCQQLPALVLALTALWLLKIKTTHFQIILILWPCFDQNLKILVHTFFSWQPRRALRSSQPVPGSCGKVFCIRPTTVSKEPVCTVTVHQKYNVQKTVLGTSTELVYLCNSFYTKWLVVRILAYISHGNKIVKLLTALSCILFKQKSKAPELHK